MITPTDIIVDYNSNIMSVVTDTDKVPYTSPYYVKVYPPSDIDKVIDYKDLSSGGAAIKHNRPLHYLNFDVNSNGELVVIGEDAANYSIDSEGNLVYDLVTGGVGEMIIEDTFIIL